MNHYRPISIFSALLIMLPLLVKSKAIIGLFLITASLHPIPVAGTIPTLSMLITKANAKHSFKTNAPVVPLNPSLNSSSSDHLLMESCLGTVFPHDSIVPTLSYTRGHGATTNFAHHGRTVLKLTVGGVTWNTYPLYVVDLDFTFNGVSYDAYAGFCIEEEELISANTTYTNEFTSIPTENAAAGSAGTGGSTLIPIGGIGTIAAGKARYLYDNHFTSLDADSWNPINATAFQLALWNLTHDTDFVVTTSSTNGTYIDASANSGDALTAINLAQTWLTTMGALGFSNSDWSDYTSTIWHLSVLASDDTGGADVQDLILAEPIDHCEKTSYYLNHGFSDGDTILLTDEGRFFDAGGPLTNHGSTDYVVTFCSNSGQRIRADFDYLDIPAATASLTVYNGVAPPFSAHKNIGSFNNNSVTPNWPMVSSDSCLTFRYVAGGSSPGKGWDVCFTSEPSCDDNLLNNPSFEVDCDVCATPDWQTNGISTQRRFWTKEADGAMAAWVTWGDMWQTVTNITGGYQYDLSFYACVHDNTPTQKVSLVSYSAGIVLDSVGVDINHICDTDSTFAGYNLSLITSPNADSIRVIASSPGNGFPFKYTKVDRMCLQEVPREACNITLSHVQTDCVDNGNDTFTATYDIIVHWSSAPPTGGISLRKYGTGTLSTTSISAATIAGANSDTLIGALSILTDGNGSTGILATFDNDLLCKDSISFKTPPPCPTLVKECANLTNAEIGGTVFEDWNYDGRMNQHDTIGVQGIKVLAFDCNNHLVDSTYTDGNGNYIFSGLSSDQTYRIEFQLPEYVSCWACPTTAGPDNGTTVQFVQTGNCASLGIANPNQYCADTIPYAVVPCYVGQAHNGTYKDSAAVVSFNLNWTGEIGAASHTKPIVLATHEQIGAVYGIAYHQAQNKSFASAYYKRGAGYGPNGPGAIYQIDHSGGGISLFTDINSLFSGNPAGTDAHDFSGDPNSFDYDLSSRTDITKMSFGDIDLSKTQDTLFAINLKNKHLYLIPTNTTPTVANVDSIPLPQPQFCNPDDTRPFALGKDWLGNLYIGYVCSNEFGSSDGLEAYVYRWEGGNVFTQVLQFDLDFHKGLGSDSWENWGSQGNFPFNTNRDDSPILADIEFDGVDMVLGFRNRLGDQSYRPSAHVDGDLYRACWNGGDGWHIEDGGNCGRITGTYQGTISTPSDPRGPGSGHYYDNETSTFGTPASSGGLLYYDGMIGDIVTDPFNAKSAGILYYKRDGRRLQGYEIFQSTATFVTYNFGKINGLGDVEVLCTASAPLEIGNLIWEDTDEDGLQDACETGVDGIIVQLYNRNGLLVSLDTTANQGQYYFNKNNVDTTGIAADGSPNSGSYTGLNYATEYYIVFGNTQFSSSQFIVNSAAYHITPIANAGNNDHIDSDVIGNNLTTGSLGNRPNGLPFIVFTTGEQGCGDHKYDMGLTPSPCFEITELIPDFSICNGEQLDSLSATTSFTSPDSIAFVYFTSPQTDASIIYTNGIGIDTVQINSLSNNVSTKNVRGFNNLGTAPLLFYVYAIVHPKPSANNCRPYEEIIVTVNACDWGDLPDISTSTNQNDYQTTKENRGPVHVIISGLMLGTTIDGEIDGQSSGDALGDGIDEDGVQLFPTLNLYPNLTFRLPFTYTNTTGNTAHLEAWIDWNGDGDFDEANEMVIDWDDGTTSFSNRLEITIPATVLTEEFLGWRIRLSHQNNMTPYGFQSNGEVEDYLIKINCPQVCLPIQTTVIKN